MKPKVILVPDLIYWVTAKIAFAVAKQYGDAYDFRIVSEGVLAAKLRTDPGYLVGYQIVHALTPHIATRLKDFIRQPTKLVATIHHVEDARSVEPMAYADAIMTVSPQWDRYLHNHYPLRSDNIYIAKNGIDTCLFSPAMPKKKGELRRKYGIPTAKFVVGFSCKRTSNSCDRKGVDVLEKLIRSSRLAEAGVHWVVRGPGWNDFISTLGVANTTYLPFEIGDINLAHSYQAMDTYIITSRIEGGPVPLLEAMSCGLLALSTPVGIAREAIRHSSNGFLVPFGGDQKIIDTLLSIISNPGKRATIGAEARQTVIANYAWPSTLDNIKQLYSTANASGRSTIDHHQVIVAGKSGITLDDRRLVPYKTEENILFADFLRNEGAIKASIFYYLSALFFSVGDGPKQLFRTGKYVGRIILEMARGGASSSKLFRMVRKGCRAFRHLS